MDSGAQKIRLTKAALDQIATPHDDTADPTTRHSGASALDLWTEDATAAAPAVRVVPCTKMVTFSVEKYEDIKEPVTCVLSSISPILVPATSGQSSPSLGSHCDQAAIAAPAATMPAVSPAVVSDASFNEANNSLCKQLMISLEHNRMTTPSASASNIINVPFNSSLAIANNSSLVPPVADDDDMWSTSEFGNATSVPPVNASAQIGVSSFTDDLAEDEYLRRPPPPPPGAHGVGGERSASCGTQQSDSSVVDRGPLAQQLDPDDTRQYRAAVTSIRSKKLRFSLRDVLRPKPSSSQPTGE